MNIVRFTVASVAALLALLALNMFVFPLIFPSGVAAKFANTRSEPLVLLHLAAFVATAVLLTLLGAVVRPAASISGAASVGAIAGLLAALPSTLHTQALARVTVSAEVAAVMWTTITWSLAAAVAHWVYHRHGVSGA
jgi:hypothetical protein